MIRIIYGKNSSGPIKHLSKNHIKATNKKEIADLLAKTFSHNSSSCLCKTLECMINTRLMWFLESNGLITNSQCGFRSKRSTVDHLVRLETFVREAFIKKEHLTAVFFDLEKAYDTTWNYA